MAYLLDTDVVSEPAIARTGGKLGAPNPVPTVDGLLAATAHVQGLALATLRSRLHSRDRQRQHAPDRYARPLNAPPNAENVDPGSRDTVTSLPEKAECRSASTYISKSVSGEAGSSTLC